MDLSLMVNGLFKGLFEGGPLMACSRVAPLMVKGLFKGLFEGGPLDLSLSPLLPAAAQ